MTNPATTPAPEDEAIAFAPATSHSRRHDGWTPERQRLFIDMLAATGVVALAARACGKSAASVYALRRRPGAESFAEAWDAALFQGRQEAFDRALARGVEGVITPRFYRGLFVGTRHTYDNRAMIAALRHIDPPKHTTRRS